VMNTSYLGGEWYIDEMKTRANEAAPVPFSLPKSKYTFVNDWLPVTDDIKRPVHIREVIDFVTTDHPDSKRIPSNRSLTDFIPTRRIALSVAKENASASSIVNEANRDLMVDTVYPNFTTSSLYKNELMILDMLDNFEWKRPICLTQP